MRILGLDVGTKTIGVAVSDPMGWTAQGVGTLQRKDPASDHQAILDWVREFGVAEILLGLPLNMDGTEGTQAEKVRKFGEELKGQISVLIRFWDERLSTVSAERSLLEADLSRAKRRKVINKIAAVLILQAYLDWRREGGVE